MKKMRYYLCFSFYVKTKRYRDGNIFVILGSKFKALRSIF